MKGFERKKLKCAIYLRVSTDRQAEEGCGLEVQEKGCLEAIEYRDWIYYKTYKDDGYSGVDPIKDRPQLKQLIEDAEDRKFEMVMVYMLDRLGRTLDIITKIAKKLERFDIGIASRKDNFDTSSGVGKFTMQILGGVAELDRTAIIEKMTKGRNERRKQKGYAGGKVPFGYKLVNGKDKKKKKTVEIDKEEAVIVRRIFQLSAEGLSSTLIAEKLDEEGIKPKLAQSWSRQIVYKILGRKETYEGGLMNDNVNDVRWPRII